MESYSNYERALEVLWAKFSLFTMKLICIPEGTFAHLGTSKELLELMVNPGVHGLYYSGARLIKSTFFDESSTDSSSKSYGILSFGNTITLMSHANNGDPLSIYLYEYSLLSRRRIILRVGLILRLMRGFTIRVLLRRRITLRLLVSI